ncbi:hypothetical protein [Archangium lansingense]|uniref:Lipoprotein n=1 Tax=Archangium lansingense TaxID=2995310 RepID=A0ABT4A1V5_9BACT|nr:hypothetical protein [Archangium lansinium]MCY1075274.1 hypothetical protein [Archangium lansinium]
MKTKIFGVVAVAMLALTGCGNVCDELDNAFEAVEEKARPCASAGEEPTSFNTNQCSDNLEDCTDSEKKAMSDFAKCLRELPECTPATQENFSNATLGCLLSLSGKVGETCGNAIIGG